MGSKSQPELIFFRWASESESDSPKTRRLRSPGEDIPMAYQKTWKLELSDIFISGNISVPNMSGVQIHHFWNGSDRRYGTD